MLTTLIMTFVFTLILVMKRSPMAFLGLVAALAGTLLVDIDTIVSTDMYRIIAQGCIACTFTAVAAYYHSQTNIEHIYYATWAGWLLMAFSFLRLFFYLVIMGDHLFVTLQVILTNLILLVTMAIAALILFTPDHRDMIINGRSNRDSFLGLNWFRRVGFARLPGKDKK